MTCTPDYHAYMLRFWREGEGQVWRATLEDPHSGRRMSFASLSLLAAFLEKQTGQDSGRPEATTSPARTKE